MLAQAKKIILLVVSNTCTYICYFKSLKVDNLGVDILGVDILRLTPALYHKTRVSFPDEPF